MPPIGKRNQIPDTIRREITIQKVMILMGPGTAARPINAIHPKVPMLTATRVALFSPSRYETTPKDPNTNTMSRPKTIRKTVTI
jgi:hypothetical protein